MATSGTFTSSYGALSELKLHLAWSRVQTDIPNNRSKIRLTLSMAHTGSGIYFSASKSGKLHGTSFTYTGGFSGSGTKVLRTQEVWVNHNADGSKTQNFSATFNIAINFQGSNLSSISVSGNAVIDAIPRASDFTAFSLSNTTLNQSTANTVTYTLSRKASGFSHLMTLKLGSKTIKSWTDSGTGARTEALTAAQVNTILSSRPNHTTGTLSLTMQTRSGSTNIGKAVTRTRAFSISTAVAPSASGISVAIAGSGRDKAINRYVQNITKVTSSFTRSAGYGASIASSSIVVRRVSGGSNSQTISGNSGTTKNPVGLSGSYEAIGTVRDSRGRTATSRTTFTVQAYANPKINSFTASRLSGTTTTINTSINLSYTKIGTDNPTTILMRSRPRGGSWTNHRNNTNQTGGSLNTTQNVTGRSDAQSYEFQLVVTDSFGKKAEATVNVGTSFIELSIARGKGIGVGKVHEEGALDVHGPIFIGSGEVTGRLRIDASELANEELQFGSVFSREKINHLWFRKDAIGLWDSDEERGVWRYDNRTKEFNIQAAGGFRMSKLEFTDLPLINGVQPYATGRHLRYAIIGRIVILVGVLKNITSDKTVVGKMPSNYLPEFHAHSWAQNTSLSSGKARIARWAVQSNGNIEMEHLSEGNPTSGMWFPVSTMYIY